VSVRVGVVGCGWWATFAHLPALQAHPDAEVVALAERDPAKLAAAGDRFDVAARFATAEELLAAVELDAAVVAVPNALHHPVTKRLLEAGVHVLLEKPMVIEPAHGRELIELARRHGVQLLIGYPLHYNPQAIALREQIAAGRIGAVEHVSCLYASIVRELYAGHPERYGDGVFDYAVNAPDPGTYQDVAVAGGGQGQSQASHAIALMLWLSGLTPQRVTAFTSSFELPVDLADAVAIRFGGGAIGTLSSTGGLTPGHDELVRCEIFGRDGHVTFDVYEGAAAIHTAAGVERLAVPTTAQRYPERAPAVNLVEAALGRAGNGSPPEVGLDTAALVAAMYRSAAEDRAVAVEEA
jgi:predicted dehydrogenase